MHSRHGPGCGSGHGLKQPHPLHLPGGSFQKQGHFLWTQKNRIRKAGPDPPIYRNSKEGEEKCAVEGPLSEEWRWPSLGAPNGVAGLLLRNLI